MREPIAFEVEEGGTGYVIIERTSSARLMI